MSINGLPKLDSEIQDSLTAYKNARKILQDVIARRQEKCDHPVVLETEYDGPGDIYRMCAVCRGEEIGTNLSGGDYWEPRGYGEPVLGNAPHRLVVSASRRDINELRLPGPIHLLTNLEED